MHRDTARCAIGGRRSASWRCWPDVARREARAAAAAERGADGRRSVQPRDRREPGVRRGHDDGELAEAGTITIGTKFDQPLFGLLGPDNVPVGFDVAIGALVASKLGIPFEDIEWTETVSSNREPFIQTDQVDIVVATYTINDDRKTKIDFAGPYFVAGQSIMVLEGNNDIRVRRI